MTGVPEMMRAMAVHRFGGTDAFEMVQLPVPKPGPREVLIRIQFAGVGEWDAFEREGGYARMLGTEPAFPYVLGSEGAGVVAAVGDEVERFARGDRVFAVGFLNPRGGFYAEYTAVNEDLVAFLPEGMPPEQAAAVGGVGLTALRGLQDVLEVTPGSSLLIFGASGGVGHMAIQLAKRLGGRVLAVASGADGVALARRLGADAAVDGRVDDVVAAARAFAPEGVDAALLTAGGETAQAALSTLREGGRVAYPNGVQPEPVAPSGVRVESYNGEPDGDIVRRLVHLIEQGPCVVHIGGSFALERAADAHRALEEHYLGKLVLHVGG
jgi:NADPH:quinone reductase-like Zn-dependent oxidoreductase